MKTLVKNSRNRWCITEGELTCGYPLEAYVNGKGWVNGRVEDSDLNQEYCFLSEDPKVFVLLSEQIEVRVKS